MGYVLQGVLGSAVVLEQGRVFEHARVAALRQGVGLLLMTDEFFDEARRPDSATAGLPEFWRLPAGFDQLLAAWSVQGPVAYVEAEYFGGTGIQAAAVWDAGELVMGPLVQPERPVEPSGPSPISQALRRLGVSAGDHVDEFEAVGLGRHRDLEDWLEEAS